LRANKHYEAEDKWQARVNQDWRFYFRIVGDAYIIADITPHPK
jgi:plasmid maintenance system killer protein